MSKERIALSAGTLRAEIAPTLGGALAAFYDTAGDQPVHYLRPAAPDAATPLQTACFPMVPFFSWLKGDRLVHGGRVIDLPPSGMGFVHALHGFGWTSAWQVEEASARRAVLVHRHAAGAWPWAYVAREAFGLSADGLTIALDVTNEADSDMPVGAGLHAYFADPVDLRVETEVTSMHLMSDEGIPHAADPRAAAIAAMRAGAALTRGLNNIFEGWSRTAELRWPTHAVAIAAESPFDFLCIYSPEGEDFCCIEPVTHTTNAFNAPVVPWGVTGARVLAPGGTFSARCHFVPRPAD
ncbi:MAG: aldose 1-epimerase [Rhizobiaceae bacterium]|nr:MAG: aldose 1-epimerase [Rhizobiaceae bacterium]CAG1002726.1 aldose 1-epimerase [Rhizobiaceae bacterium]